MKRIITLVLLIATYALSAQQATNIKYASTQNTKSPLWVVNDVVLTDEKVSSIVQKSLKSDDIESISVLKGANATAIYGSRAEDGAVIVTLKNSNDSSENYKAAGVLSVTGVSSNTDLLVIVDGKEMYADEATNFMSNISPEKIDSITVLKDPIALTKYGDKGKKGVLIVKLKK
jgi:hypothetical protein